jgi:hypothetical protein
VPVRLVADDPVRVGKVLDRLPAGSAQPLTALVKLNLPGFARKIADSMVVPGVRTDCHACVGQPTDVSDAHPLRLSQYNGHDEERARHVALCQLHQAFLGLASASVVEAEYDGLGRQLRAGGEVAKVSVGTDRGPPILGQGVEMGTKVLRWADEVDTVVLAVAASPVA